MRTIAMDSNGRLYLAGGGKVHREDETQLMIQKEKPVPEKGEGHGSRPLAFPAVLVDYHI